MKKIAILVHGGVVIEVCASEEMDIELFDADNDDGVQDTTNEYDKYVADHALIPIQ